MKLKAEGKAPSTIHMSSSTLGKSDLNNGKSAEAFKPVAQPPNQPCPQCGNSKLFRDGKRKLKDGSKTQRWLCRSCGYRFSESNVKVHIASEVSKTLDPIDNSHKGRIVSSSRTVQESANGFSFLLSEDIRSHNLSSVAKGLNALPLYSSSAECAPKKAKNLSATLEPKTSVGETAQTQTLKGQICKFLAALERDGIKQNSARTYLYYLQNIIEHEGNLLDPESVKEVIAKKNWSDKSKAIAVTAYSKYLQVIGGTWKPPRYKPQRKIPYIPKTEELNSLINAAYRKLSTYLLLLKSTGMRSGEAWLLKWKDIDFSRNTVTLNETEKHGTPRMFKVESQLIAMINMLPKTSNIYLFGTQATHPNGLLNFAKTFRVFRARTAFKMQNPNLNRISFHSFRHWFATMEYHKTKSILHVQERLGHKNITTTEIYTHLVNFEADAYHSATAKNDMEAQKLIETGWDYVCTSQEGTMLFRKPK